MMYNKAVMFGDAVARDAIMKSDDPRTMKAWGRKVKNFNATKWDKESQRIVYEGAYMKFSQSTELLEWMRKAECDYFVECSPYDRLWGIGIAASHMDALYPERWQGKNLLGKVLKQVHDDLVRK